jgi:hypothetical protein
MDMCFFCGSPLKLVHVHGHYQCSVCGTNAMPCCDGDNCDTNLLLHAQLNQHNTKAGENLYAAPAVHQSKP